MRVVPPPQLLLFWKVTIVPLTSKTGGNSPPCRYSLVAFSQLEFSSLFQIYLSFFNRPYPPYRYTHCFRDITPFGAASAPPWGYPRSSHRFVIPDITTMTTANRIPNKKEAGRGSANREPAHLHRRNYTNLSCMKVTLIGNPRHTAIVYKVMQRNPSYAPRKIKSQNRMRRCTKNPQS